MCTLFPNHPYVHPFPPSPLCAPYRHSFPPTTLTHALHMPYTCLMHALHALYVCFTHALFLQPPLCMLYTCLMHALHALYMCFTHTLSPNHLTCTLCMPFSPNYPYVRFSTLCALQVYDWLRVPTTANQITDI